MELTAHITDQQGVTYIATAVGGLTLDCGHSVKLYAADTIPEKWVTRGGTFTTAFTISEDLDLIEAAQLSWVSWRPCYANGVFLNGHLVFMREGPCYEYFKHLVPLDDLRVLQAGRNEITTPIIPRFRGQMVHGMEVQYPGIMVKVKYRKPSE